MNRWNRGQQGYQDRLFQIPSEQLKWRSRYHFLSEELQFLVQNQERAIWTDTFDLSTARPPSNPLIINEVGRGIIIFGLTTATIYDPSANTGIETVATSSMMAAKLNPAGDGTNISLVNADKRDYVILKHNRGFMGEFKSVALTWPAQSNNAARVVIWKWDGTPYMSGEAAT